ncbi:Retrovirus-related Pol polyprotein, partial [Mucuna pruriens]
MAEHTRSKTQTERLEDAITKLTQNQNQFTVNQKNNRATSEGEVSPRYFGPKHETDHGTFGPRMKLDVPRFDGADAAGSIFKISQFFDYHGTPEHERIQVASFYLDGPALSWFQWMYRNGQISSWNGEHFHQHLQHLELVFQKLQEGQFFLKISKCAFGQRRVEYLGHIMSKNGVELEPYKIQAMQDWPVPTSLKSLRGSLGLIGFYRRFIKNYANIVAPLTTLLRKDQFQWGCKAQFAFEEIMSAMTRALILTLPDFSLPFVIETDASSMGMGAVLMQKNHPISYFSKQFCLKLMHSSTYIRELCAITTVVKRWRPYLIGHSFTILTDHKSLKELINQLIQIPEQQMYLAKLLRFDYTIQYKAGKYNTVADALSRIHDPSSEANWTLTMSRFKFLDDLRLELARSTHY